ncbi:LADA_0F13498g1_1 [Lachancea dasiensis]|uniref:LADA_0F13498g1_1 n=1 Tax=Lachancea dasiensis TaxID=1072105 RepID=A0A1G4JMV7_9SACH|nr:LADA_0F13498g1_1 [Lachancea dasiensis]
MDHGKLSRAMAIALFERAYDRRFVIELEDSMISFMDSGLTSYQLESMNSYFRLLAHQVAEYHGLRHELAKNNDSCVVVFKGESFVRDVNKVPLQKLDPSEAKCDNWSQASSDSEGGEIGQWKGPNKWKPKVPHHHRVKDQVLASQNGLPTTPKKSTVVDDDSPQPHQFETSRYRFRRQQQASPAQGPRRRKSYKNTNTYMGPQMFYQAPPIIPPNFAMPYMLYNSYPMIYMPPENQYSQYPQGPLSMPAGQFNYGPLPEGPLADSSKGGSTLFTGNKLDIEINAPSESTSVGGEEAFNERPRSSYSPFN